MNNYVKFKLIFLILSYIIVIMVTIIIIKQISHLNTVLYR